MSESGPSVSLSSRNITTARPTSSTSASAVGAARGEGWTSDPVPSALDLTHAAAAAVVGAGA